MEIAKVLEERRVVQRSILRRSAATLAQADRAGQRQDAQVGLLAVPCLLRLGADVVELIQFPKGA